MKDDAYIYNNVITCIFWCKILGFMSYLALFFMITSIVVIALIAWSYTKSGEKWLKEL